MFMNKLFTKIYGIFAQNQFLIQKQEWYFMSQKKKKINNYYYLLKNDAKPI